MNSHYRKISSSCIVVSILGHLSLLTSSCILTARLRLAAFNRSVFLQSVAQLVSIIHVIANIIPGLEGLAAEITREGAGGMHIFNVFLQQFSPMKALSTQMTNERLLARVLHQMFLELFGLFEPLWTDLALEFPFSHMHRVDMSLKSVLDLEALPTMFARKLEIFLVNIPDVIAKVEGLPEFHGTAGAGMFG